MVSMKHTTAVQAEFSWAPVAFATYAIAALLIIVPPVNQLIDLFPWQFGVVQWRYGALGLLANTMLIPLLGGLIAVLAAHVLRQPIMLRVLASLMILSALLITAMIVLFALDALQLRPTIRPEVRGRFDLANLRVLATTAVTLGAVVALTTSAFRAARSHRNAARSLAESKGQSPAGVVIRPTA